MGYEIDFIPVGDGERSGEAIALRYGNLHGARAEQTVITIDGGTLESGDAMVEHVKRNYGTNQVDVAFLSHADNDHASGMRRVIEGLQVGKVAMHLPWNHSADVKGLMDDSRVTTDSLRERAKKNLTAAKEIHDLARSKNIAVVEPFAGASNNDGLIVLGPTRDYYQQLLANFKFMPGTENRGTVSNFAALLKQLTEKIASWVPEGWWSESLKEPKVDATSAENNSSVIFLLETDGRKLLFTGDAGVPALNIAADYAAAAGINLAEIHLFQVPHHGSRRNLGPSILNRIFGGVRQTDMKDWNACISAAADAAPKHPHKKVTNALRRRGAAVQVTAGKQVLYAFNAPNRGWTPLEPLPFYNQVEDDD